MEQKQGKSLVDAKARLPKTPNIGGGQSYQAYEHARNSHLGSPQEVREFLRDCRMVPELGLGD